MTYDKNNPLRVVTLCSGYDSQLMALERIKEHHPGFDYTCVGWSEIDPYACKLHDANFPHLAGKNLGDMTKIDWSKVPDFDLLTYSTPCFPEGTEVLTDRGYVSIENIAVGDNVITHTGNLQRVLSTMAHKHDGDMVRIKAMAFDELTCTSNHRFYVRKMKRVGHKSIRTFLAPEWLEAINLDKSYYLGCPINREERIPQWNGAENNQWGHHRIINTLSDKLSNPMFWYVCGRYVGDGWKRNGKSGNSVIICCSERNIESLRMAIESIGMHYRDEIHRTSHKLHICSNELYKFLTRYGYYAYGKYIDADTLNLPRELLKSFLDGYADSDGYRQGHYTKVSTVSKQLAYTTSIAVMKVYHRPVAIWKIKTKDKTGIEGRTVNQRDYYVVSWKDCDNVQDKAFYEDGFIWYPINDIQVYNDRIQVYNLEVEHDNSYIVRNAIVHNCQSISQAGLQRGIEEGSGTRSSILWFTRNAIITKRPKFLLMENVKALVSKKFLPFYNMWRAELESYGYDNYGQVLNASDYNVPQNRERIFLVSIRNDGEPTSFTFPRKMPLQRHLVDVLEDKVDEKYYLSDEQVSKFEQVTADKSHNHNFKPRGGKIPPSR